MPNDSVWERIRRARMVRVLLVYLGAAWGVLEVADLLQESLSLPPWVVPVAILLLLIGLVIILATAWVQAGAGSGGAAPDRDDRPAGEDLPGPWEVDPKGLAASLRQGRLPHLTWSRSILGGVFAFWFLFGLAGLYVVIKDRGRSFAPTEAVADVSAEGIAIVPFTVRGEDLEVWREGMVDLLSTSLDDVGGYRTIDSRTVMARWSEAVPEGEAADLATTLEVAKRTGARYAVSGSAVGLGDKVRLAAEVYDVSSGESVGTGQVEGPADSVLSLVNQLAVQTMQVLLRQEGGEGVTARAAMSLTTASLPALKAYLEGEAYFRRADFDRAIEAYERALNDDPDLALAHFRLADAYGWSENIQSERGYEHLLEAERLADRLSHRDRAILDGNVALIEGDLSAVESVREITRRYPDDPDAWFLLSEFYFHHGDDLLLDWDDIGGVFDKPVELEPRFAPYYVHQFDYAVIQRDTAGARRAMENLRLHGSESRAKSAELAYDLVLGDSTAQATARASMRDESDGVLLKAYPDLWLAAARPVAFEPVFLELTRRRIGGGGLGNLYMTGGKADAAMEFWSGPDLSPLARVWSTLTIGGWVRPMPEEEMREVFVPGACGPVAEGATHCLIGLGKGLADLGETDDVAAMVTELRTVISELREAGDEEAADDREQIADAIDAYGRARAGTGSDHAAAIADLKELQGSGTVAEGWIKWWLGDLLLEDGELREAAVYYEASRHGFLNSLANYRLGGIYEELGETEKARAAYIRFLQAWEEADPDLPQVETARTALETLLAG
jgi:tetratricopeptide (TPR) repeat protein